jgi:flagellar hook-length control protein FliK
MFQRRQTMSASVSSPSLAQSLQGSSTRKWSDQTMIAGLIGSGNQQSSSFSRTLQHQLHDTRAQPASPTRADAAPSRPSSAAAQPRDTERSPQRSAAREAERPRTQSAETAAEPQGNDNAAPPNGASGGSEAQGEHSGASRNAEAADTPADAAALAGLPAAIAAQFTDEASEAGEADASPATDDSAGKSLQNAGLLPKGQPKPADTGTGIEPAAQSAQGRLPIAAVIADKAAAAAQPLKAAGDDIATQQPAQLSGGHHGANLLGVLRHAPAQAPTPQLPVHTPASRQAWAEDVGNQVRWMIGRAESKAELVLTPPNLGKLEVSISLNGDQTTAQFVASSQAARDALEQALPRLREILQQSGISLGQADVSTSGEHDSGGEDSGQGRRTSGGGTIADSVDGGKPAPWLRQHDGLVDTFV